MNPFRRVLKNDFDRWMGFLCFFWWILAVSGCKTIHEAPLIPETHAAIFRADWETAQENLKRLEKGGNTTPEVWLMRAIFERLKPPKPNWMRASNAVLNGLMLDPKNLPLRRERLQQLRSGDPFFGSTYSVDFALVRAAKAVLQLDSTDVFAREGLAIGLWRQFRDAGHVLFPEKKVQEQALETGKALEDAFIAHRTSPELIAALTRFYAQRPLKTSLLDTLITTLVKQNQVFTANALSLIVLVKQGQFEEATTPFKAIESNMPPHLKRAFYQITPLLTAAEKRAFKADSAAFSEQFWKERDPRNLTTLSERQLEHAMRVVYADLFGWIGTEKGEVVIRYGLPLTQKRMEEPDKEGWDIGRTAGFEIWHYDAFTFGFLALVRQMQNLTTLSEDHRPSKGEQEQRREQTQAGSQSDLASDLRYFKNASGRTEAIYSLGLPILQAGKPSNTLKSAIFWRQNNQNVISEALTIPTDSTQNPLVRLQNETLFVVAKTLNPPKGHFEVIGEVLQQAFFGQSSTITDVPAFSETDFSLSDLLLAYQLQETGADTLFIQRGGYTFQPAPKPTFRKPNPVYFYLEAYHLPVDMNGERAYTIEARLIPDRHSTEKEDLVDILGAVFTKQPSGSAVQFSGLALSPTEVIALGLETKDLASGAYLLTVRVQANGKERLQTRKVILE